MAARSNASGELYFIGEKDPATQNDTGYVKIGIVRENDDRDTDKRVKEHQTGNPRMLHVVETIRTPIVERVETAMHGAFAPQRVSGEWFILDPSQKDTAIAAARAFADEAAADLEAMSVAEALKKTASGPEKLTPTDEHIALHATLVALKAQVKACNTIAADLVRVLEALHAGGIDCGRVLTYQPSKPRESFDEKSFKDSHTALWEQFQVTKPTFSGSFLAKDPKSSRPDPLVLNPRIADLAATVSGLTGESGPATHDVNEVHRVYLTLLALQAPLEWKLTLVEDRARAAVGTASEIDGLFVWKRELTSKTSLDKAALKNDHPDVYAQFTSFAEVRPSVIVARDRGYFL